jgi:hypothetical protein
MPAPRRERLGEKETTRENSFLRVNDKFNMREFQRIVTVSSAAEIATIFLWKTTGKLNCIIISP